MMHGGGERDLQKEVLWIAKRMRAVARERESVSRELVCKWAREIEAEARKDREN